MKRFPKFVLVYFIGEEKSLYETDNEGEAFMEMQTILEMGADRIGKYSLTLQASPTKKRQRKSPSNVVPIAKVED